MRTDTADQTDETAPLAPTVQDAPTAPKSKPARKRGGGVVALGPTPPRPKPDIPKTPPSRAVKSAHPQARLLTIGQASLEYGPSYTSIRDLVIRGELPWVRLGVSKRIWLRRSDLETLIAHGLWTNDK